jgi:hypothetical protein
MQADRAAQILFHEILHAVFDVMGCASGFDLGDKEEALIRAITPALVSVLGQLNRRRE